MINQSELTLEKQMLNTIAELQAAVRDIKTTQLTGGDSVKMGTRTATIHTTIPPNTNANFNIFMYLRSPEP